MVRRREPSGFARADSTDYRLRYPDREMGLLHAAGGDGIRLRNFRSCAR